MKGLGKQITENAGLVAVMLVSMAVICLIAWFAEKKLIRSEKRDGTLKLTVTAMMGALGFVLMLYDFPVPFAPGFYKLDFSEVPVLICAFAAGPLSGVIAEFLKIILKLLIRGTSTAFVGEFANFVTGCSFILPASVIYLYRKTKRGALIGCIAGTLSIALAGSLFNAFYLLPAFSKLYGMPLDSIIEMGSVIYPSVGNFTIAHFILLCVAPLNLLKGAAVSLIVMFVYKPISRVIKNVFR